MRVASTAPAIDAEDPLSPELMPLLAASDAELTANYAAEQIFTASPAELAARGCLFLVARIDREPAGCVGLVPSGEACAEIKRLFVTPRARRTGLGRRLVNAIEDAALAAGYRRLRLETGTEQHAAMRLYEAMGYRPIPAWGRYALSPTSRCYEKALTSAPPCP